MVIPHTQQAVTTCARNQFIKSGPTCAMTENVTTSQVLSIYTGEHYYFFGGENRRTIDNNQWNGSVSRKNNCGSRKNGERKQHFTFIFASPGLPPYKKHGNHRKSYMVIYENTKVVESTIEDFGNMQVIKSP